LPKSKCPAERAVAGRTASRGRGSRRAASCRALAGLCALLGCTPAGRDDGAAPAAAPAFRQVDLSHHFAALGAAGAFVLYDEATDRLVVHDSARAATRFVPASTFKILNSLIALDEGVLADEHEVVAWDGVDRGDWWNGDMDMTTAFQRSAVWFYQRIARQVGVARMRAWVERTGYGNADIGGGIDRFWLEGELRISALEQVDLLRRLHAGTLPFSQRSQRIVRRVMRMDEGEGYVLSGKTGWARQQGVNYGWLVGWVEREGGTAFFATQIESAAPEFPMRRAQQEITRGALRELDVLPAHADSAPEARLPVQSPERLPWDSVDRGIGVVAFREASSDGPRADTLVVRAMPAAAAAVVAMVLLDRRGAGDRYGLAAAHPVRLNAAEFAYEELGIPFDSLAAGWARVIYGRTADGGPAIGWVHTAADRARVLGWRDLLQQYNLFVPDTETPRFHDAPDGAVLDIPLQTPDGAGGYDIVPVHAHDGWLLVRVVVPSGCAGEAGPPAERRAWIRYLDAAGRPLLWPRTRGC
jgi:beta-lactamase class D